MFWKRKKKKDFEEDELLEEIEREFERMLRIMKKVFDTGIPQTTPVVHGIKITIGPDGIPRVEEFGNIRPTREKISEYREPLVDVLERDSEIVVTAELPGVDKKDIKLRVHDNKLYIQAESPPFKYKKTVVLPVPVDPKQAEAHFKNGILEIKLKKVEEYPEKGEEIKIS